MMTFLYWFYGVCMLIGCVLEFTIVGKPLKPITPAVAAGAIIFQAPLAYLLIRAALAGV